MSNNDLKHGFAIFNILQKPSENEIHNILYFDEAVLKLAGEKARDEIKYLHKMYDLIKQRRLAIEAATQKWQMDHDTLLAICHTINNFGDEPQKMAAKHAILNMDFAKITDVNGFAAELQNHSNTRNIGKGIRTTRNNNNNRTTNSNTPNASLNNIRAKPKCAACGERHYLSECTNTAKLDELKQTKPEIYWKYINPPLYRHGDKCPRKDTCKFRHSHTEGIQRPTAQTHTTLSQPEQETPKKISAIRIAATTVNNQNTTPWILDTGSTVHVTTHTRNLSNIKPCNLTLETQAGSTSVTTKGHASKSIKDVYLNPKGDLNIISVSKYLHDNPNQAITFTQKGAYTVPMDEIRKSFIHDETWTTTRRII